MILINCNNTIPYPVKSHLSILVLLIVAASFANVSPKQLLAIATIYSLLSAGIMNYSLPWSYYTKKFLIENFIPILQLVYKFRNG